MYQVNPTYTYIHRVNPFALFRPGPSAQPPLGLFCFYFCSTGGEAKRQESDAHSKGGQLKTAVRQAGGSGTHDTAGGGRSRTPRIRRTF